METAITIVLILIVITLVYFLLKSLSQTQAFRLFLIGLKHEKRERLEHEKKVHEDNREKGDEVEELLRKIRLGEEVSIPVEVFDYIFANLNSFTILSNEGELILIKPKEYAEFREKTLEMLGKRKITNKYVSDKVVEAERAVIDKPYETVKHKDGTIVKKDNLNGKVTIMNPDGRVVMIDKKSGQMILEKPLDDEEENIIMNKKKQKELEAKNKRLEQENRLIKNKTNQQNNSDTNEDIEDNKNKNKKGKVKNASVEYMAKLAKRDENSNFAENEKFTLDDENTDKRNDKKQTKREEKDKKRQEEKIEISFENSEKFIKKELSHSKIERLIFEILKIDNPIFDKVLFYDEDSNAIKISIDWLAYKISKNIKNVGHRANFLSMFYRNKQYITMNPIFLNEIVNAINSSSTMAFGSKILLQEEDGKFFDVVNIEKNNEVYKMICIHLFLNNPLGEKISKNISFEKISKTNYKMSKKNTGKRVYYSEIINGEKQ